jgi:hypothetical protein
MVMAVWKMVLVSCVLSLAFAQWSIKDLEYMIENHFPADGIMRTKEGE